MTCHPRRAAAENQEWKEFLWKIIFAFFFFCGGGSTGRFSFPLETIPARGPRVCLTCEIWKVETIDQHWNNCLLINNLNKRRQFSVTTPPPKVHRELKQTKMTKRRQTKGLMSRTVPLQVRYKSQYISMLSPAKQQCEITKKVANFSFFL